MNIKLNVNKNTFIQYLLELGYNYKIRQYEELIENIGKKIQKSIIDALNESKIDEVFNTIFEKDTGLLFLSDFKKIKHIKPAYIVSEIESGIYDLYLEENGFLIDENVKKGFYIKNRLLGLEKSEIKNILINHYHDLFTKNNSIDKKMKRVSDKSLLEILDEEKENYDKEIKEIVLSANNRYGTEYTFPLKEYSFNNGTKLKINHELIESYFKEQLIEVIDLDKKLNSRWTINQDKEEENKKIREYLNKKMSNIRDDDKEGFQNLFGFIYDSNYNIKSYVRSIVSYMENNSINRIYLYDILDAKNFDELIDEVAKIKGFEYLKDIKEELENVLAIVSFDLIVEDYQGKDIVLTFEEMLEKGFIDNSEVFKLGQEK